MGKKIGADATFAVAVCTIHHHCQDIDFGRKVMINNSFSPSLIPVVNENKLLKVMQLDLLLNCEHVLCGHLWALWEYSGTLDNDLPR